MTVNELRAKRATLWNTMEGFLDTQIGRASCGKECRSRWSPYH